jgi:hypothetical protein
MILTFIKVLGWDANRRPLVVVDKPGVVADDLQLLRRSMSGNKLESKGGSELCQGIGRPRNDSRLVKAVGRNGRDVDDELKSNQHSRKVYAVIERSQAVIPSVYPRPEPRLRLGLCRHFVVRPSGFFRLGLGQMPLNITACFLSFGTWNAASGSRSIVTCRLPSADIAESCPP